MKYALTLLLLFTVSSFSQENDISKLENLKEGLNNRIKELNDSLLVINQEIAHIKSNEILKKTSDSTFQAKVNNGAKIRINPTPFGEIIGTIQEEELVTILDYSDGYFGICYNSVCGYINEVWIKFTDEIFEYKKVKKEEEKELKRIEYQNKLKAKKAEYTKIDNEYLKKYGQKTYNKLKEGHFWIGMNREMATISLGSPRDINRSVGSWGVHEQWVYDNMNLYFENGKLTSWQD